MKKIFTTLATAFLLGGLCHAQTTVVNGQVVDCNGDPVTGILVHFSTDSTTGVFHYNHDYTDGGGYYTDSVPYTVTPGTPIPLFITVQDADGNYYYMVDTLMGAGTITAGTIVIPCADTTGGTDTTGTDTTTTPGGGTCYVSYFPYQDSTGVNDTLYLVANYGSSSPLTRLISWDFGDGTGAMGEVTTHTYATSGPYNVCVTMLEWNSALDSCYAVYCDTLNYVVRAGFVVKTVTGNFLSVHENAKPANLLVYPNPAQNMVTINTTEMSKIGSVRIVDMTGRQQASYNVNAMGNTFQLDLGTLENGSYLMVMYNHNNELIYTHTLLKR